MAEERVDLDALEALAKAADLWGSWAIWPDLTDGGFTHVGNADGVIPEGEMATPEDAEPNPIAKAYTPEIGDFIAAADPSTIQALIRELREAREALGEWEYSIAYPVDTPSGVQWDNDGIGEMDRADAEAELRDHRNSYLFDDRLVRRRKAGPWEPVEESKP